MVQLQLRFFLPKIAESLHTVQMWLPYFLPAATKFGQGNVFTGICDSVHREGGVYLSACWDTNPPGADTPPQNRHPPWSRHPPGSRPPSGPDTPQSRHLPGTRHPPEQTCPKGDNLPEQTPPNREADSGIQSTRGQYASYWNAFLFKKTFLFNN